MRSDEDGNLAIWVTKRVSSGPSYSSLWAGAAGVTSFRIMRRTGDNEHRGAPRCPEPGVLVAPHRQSVYQQFLSISTIPGTTLSVPKKSHGSDFTAQGTHAWLFRKTEQSGNMKWDPHSKQEGVWVSGCYPEGLAICNKRKALGRGQAQF